MNKQKYYFLKTFGCQMNILDGEYVHLLLSKIYCKTDNVNEAEIIILNTCSVKENSENKLLNFLNYIRKRKYNKKYIFVGLLGCFVEKINVEFIKKILILTAL